MGALEVTRVELTGWQRLPHALSIAGNGARCNVSMTKHIRRCCRNKLKTVATFHTPLTTPSATVRGEDGGNSKSDDGGSSKATSEDMNTTMETHAVVWRKFSSTGTRVPLARIELRRLRLIDIAVDLLVFSEESQEVVECRFYGQLPKGFRGSVAFNCDEWTDSFVKLTMDIGSCNTRGYDICRSRPIDERRGLLEVWLGARGQHDASHMLQASSGLQSSLFAGGLQQFSKNLANRSPLLNGMSAPRQKGESHFFRDRHEWLPTDWKSLWGYDFWPAESDMLGLHDGHEIVTLMEEEFKRDCVIFFNTMFPRIHGPHFQRLASICMSSSSPRLPGNPAMDGKSGESFAPYTGLAGGSDFEHDYSSRIGFLKRLYLLFAYCGVYVSEGDNGSGGFEPWPFPLAAVLGHGARVLICLEGLDPNRFINFLLQGLDAVPDEWPPAPIGKRLAATHDVRLNANIGRLKEIKLKDVAQNLADGLRGNHLALDLPIGGVGNPSPYKKAREGFVIGPHGDVLKAPGVPGGQYCVVPKVQGGHLYMRTNDFGFHAFKSEECLMDKSLAASPPSISGNVQGITRTASAPCLKSAGEESLSVEDFAWLQEEAFHDTDGLYVFKTPPSEAALSTLLMICNGQRIERESARKLLNEFKNGEARLVSRPSGTGRKILREIMVLVVHVSCSGQVLVQRNRARVGASEMFELKLLSVQLGTEESWRDGCLRAFSQKLGVNSLDDLGIGDLDYPARVIDEGASQSIPGITTRYLTDVAKIELLPPYAERLLCFPSDSIAARTHAVATKNYFQVKYEVQGKKPNVLQWCWMPEFQALAMLPKLQQSALLDALLETLLPVDDTGDEAQRWLRSAFHTDGQLPVPESSEVLEIYLKLMGIDTRLFGNGTYKSIREFWQELVSQESSLSRYGKQLVRVCEPLVVKLTQGGETLVHTDVEVNGVTRRKNCLLVVSKRRAEDWQDAALRALSEKLLFTKDDMKAHLKPSAGSASSFLGITEEQDKSSAYPLPVIHRTHLVMHDLNQGYSPQEWHMNEGEKGFITRNSHGDGDQILHWRWFSETEANAADIKGVHHNWKRESLTKENQSKQRRYSSVLLGLEGSAPLKSSPFGHTHDTSGKSNPISCTGGRKWRIYGMNCAMQVPGEYGAMRLWIDDKTYAAFVSAIQELDLLDPKEDIALATCSESYQHTVLERRALEKVFFQQILSSNSTEAKQILSHTIGQKTTNRKRRDMTLVSPRGSNKPYKNLSKPSSNTVSCQTSPKEHTSDLPGQSRALDFPTKVGTEFKLDRPTRRQILL